MKEETTVLWKVIQVISIFISTVIVLCYLPYHSMQIVEKVIVLGATFTMLILIILATIITVLVELNEYKTKK